LPFSHPSRIDDSDDIGMHFLQISDIRLTNEIGEWCIFFTDSNDSWLFLGEGRQDSGIETFTPSVTGREWGKTGAHTAGGVGARLAFAVA